jgi:tRNA(Ile)-lysidine synthetase-like protein
MKGAGDQVRWPKDLPPAVVRRVFHIWLSETGNPDQLSADALDNVLKAVELRRETSFSLGRKNLLVLRPVEGVLKIIPMHKKPLQWADCVLPFGGTLCLPYGAHLQCLRVRVSESLLDEVLSGEKDPACFAFLDVRALGQARFFLVRTRRPKDRYQPLGMGSSVKLQNLLVNHKVPASIRDFLPVVTLPGGEVLWCPGCPGPENYRLSTATKWALALKYTQR